MAYRSRLLTILKPKGSTPLLLDTVTGAVAAYSLRKLRNAYSGPAIRVRRSSDNAEQDIGFVSGVLNTASLLTFCGVGDGFVATWYDQSGNSKNVTNGTAAAQPQIVSSGSVITLNSKPAISSDGVDDSLSATAFGFSTDAISAFNVNSKNSGAAVVSMGYGITPNGGLLINNSSLRISLDGRPDGGVTYRIANSGATPTNSQVLQAVVYDKTTMKAAMNGGSFGTLALAIASIVYSAQTLSIQSTIIPSFAAGLQQELIIFNADKTFEKATIESDINTYYNIY